MRILVTFFFSLFVLFNIWSLIEMYLCRRNIINEIMQATAINNLKKAKGIDTNRETTPQSTGKGDLLQVCLDESPSITLLGS